MDRHVVPPITIIAVTAAAFFYGLTLVQTGSRITSFIVITAFLLLCAFLLFLVAVPIAAQLPHRKFQPQHCRQKRVRAMVRFALCVIAGAVIGSYAARTLQREQRPPQTLASLPTVRMLIAELTGEPVPAGSDYYRIPVKLIACNAGRNEQFSASGAVQLFVPATLVRGTQEVLPASAKRNDPKRQRRYCPVRLYLQRLCKISKNVVFMYEG